VVTPTYNCAGFLKRAIDSVLVQTYSNLEYIIVDDASTDETEAVVAPYLSDKRVKYVKLDTNSGEGAAVNKGWQLKTGDYFVQLNSDDVLSSTALENTVAALEKNKKAVLVYGDFYFIDADDRIIKETCSPDWNFIEALSSYSCYAAGIGTMVRVSSFSDWKTIRSCKFKHIDDVEMYYRMAIVGDFIHIKDKLGSWRQHKGGISDARLESCEEIKKWFDSYFTENSFPVSVELSTYQAICRYVFSLHNLHISRMEIDWKASILGGGNFMNLQIGDTDLVGNKFNGHDLHIYLRRRGIYSDHLVLNKQSQDPNTYIYPTEKRKDILFHKSFLLSDVVHLHLIHNKVMDVEMLPIISALKPTVWTLHDPWALSGHCIYHFDCEKWKTGCGDCPYLDIPFAIEYDNTASEFENKKQCIQNSQISAIVASEWMENKVRQSPIWEGKDIYRIPFGIDHDMFKPIEIKEAKEKLGISPNDFVLFFRSDPRSCKGLDIIEQALSKIKSDKKITILTVGSKELLKAFKEQYQIKEFGWITDDNELVKLYQACDLFLMPSRQEAFGMMAVEAMSCGKVVIAIDGDTALPGTINAPICGVAAKENDYAAEVQRLMDNPAEILSRGIDSLNFAKANYNNDRYVDNLIAVYNKVIRKHRKNENSPYVFDHFYRLCRESYWPSYYRYLLRPMLRILFSRRKVKGKFDPKFRKYF
jgi:glycosyltransferase involved in cell wall biosynthesis/GT2 family glycosyltransferase